MPSQLIIIFIITKKGKREGKTALKNNFAPDKVYCIQTFGAIIIWRMIREQITVIKVFILKVLNNLNNKNIMTINSIVSSNLNFLPLLKYYSIKYI